MSGFGVSSALSAEFVLDDEPSLEELDSELDSEPDSSELCSDSE